MLRPKLSSPFVLDVSENLVDLRCRRARQALLGGRHPGPETAAPPCAAREAPRTLPRCREPPQIAALFLSRHVLSENGRGAPLKNSIPAVNAGDGMLPCAER